MTFILQLQTDAVSWDSLVQWYRSGIDGERDGLDPLQLQLSLFLHLWVRSPAVATFFFFFT